MKKILVAILASSFLFTGVASAQTVSTTVQSDTFQTQISQMSLDQLHVLYIKLLTQLLAMLQKQLADLQASNGTASSSTIIAGSAMESQGTASSTSASSSVQITIPSYTIPELNVQIQPAETANSTQTPQPIMPPLTITQNSSFDGRVSKNSVLGAWGSNQRIASYTFTASEDVTVPYVAFRVSDDATLKLQNLVLVVNNQRVLMSSTVYPGQTADNVGARPPSVLILSGMTMTYDVYADVLSNSTAGVHIAPISLVNDGLHGYGNPSPLSIAGQDVTLASN